MTGWRDRETGAFGQSISLFDTMVAIDRQGFHFVGEDALVAYGGRVPLTSTVLSQNLYHYGNESDEREELKNGLMYGVCLRNGERHPITPLDLAILRDMGLWTIP